MGDSGASVHGNNLLNVPAVWGKCWSYNLHQNGGLKCCLQLKYSMYVLMEENKEQCGGTNRSLRIEKLLPWLFPAGVRAVVTNDWCIT